MPTLNRDYWESRYQREETGWDAGTATGPLKAYFDQLTQKEERILIPGCGNAHEAVYLASIGFTNITVLDIAAPPLKRFRVNYPEYVNGGQITLIQEDFFVHQGEYDRIIEQTFFCAIDPAWRDRYVVQMHQLLKTGGRLAGLLFNFPLTEEGPPFGGSEEEYQSRFDSHFSIHVLEPAYNSIPPRAGRELFFIFEK